MPTADQYREAEFGYTLAEPRRGFKIHAAVDARARHDAAPEPRREPRRGKEER